MSGWRMMTTVPPSSRTGRSWLLHPVTWNSGTETSVRSDVPRSRSKPTQRTAVSVFARKLRCVVIAPLGKPVVPLV